MKTVLKVRVVHLEDCAATPATLDLVARAAAKLGVAIELEKVIVRDQAAARRHGHLGSPTVLVSGRKAAIEEILMMQPLSCSTM